MKGAERFILVSQRRLTEDSGGACLLKTPEDRESLEIFVPVAVENKIHA